MSFKGDCEATPGLVGAARPGLQALQAPDRARVSKRAGTQLTHSVDVDTALRATLPNAARWDYAVAQKSAQAEHVHWIEEHPASGGASISEMQAKLAWLKGWLPGTALLAYPRTVVWVASGRSSFTSRDPKIKALAQQGLQFAGGHLLV